MVRLQAIKSKQLKAVAAASQQLGALTRGMSLSILGNVKGDGTIHLEPF